MLNILTRFISDFTITTKKGFSNYFNSVSKYVMNMKEGNVLFNDAHNTFYFRLHGVRHRLKDHSENKRGNSF